MKKPFQNGIAGQSHSSKHREDLIEFWKRLSDCIGTGHPGSPMGKLHRPVPRAAPTATATPELEIPVSQERNVPMAKPIQAIS